MSRRREVSLDEDDGLSGLVKDVKAVERRLRHRLLPRNAWQLVPFFELFLSAPKDELHQWYLGLFGDHIVPAVLYRYTQILRPWRPDLVNSRGKPLVTTAPLEGSGSSLEKIVRPICLCGGWHLNDHVDHCICRPFPRHLYWQQGKRKDDRWSCEDADAHTALYGSWPHRSRGTFIIVYTGIYIEHLSIYNYVLCKSNYVLCNFLNYFILYYSNIFGLIFSLQAIKQLNKKRFTRNCTNNIK